MTDDEKSLNERVIRFFRYIRSLDRTVSGIAEDMATSPTVSSVADDSRAVCGMMITLSDTLSKMPDFDKMASDFLAVAILKLAGFDLAGELPSDH